MGVVYLAHNKMMGRDEVLKVMGRTSWGTRERSNASNARSSRSPGSATPTSSRPTTPPSSARASSFRWNTWRVTTCPKLIKTEGRLAVADACLYIHQAVLGLQHAHEEGLVHRDIKPDNLMLSRKGNKATVKILDFGLAKAAREEKDRWWSDLRPDRALGTPALHGPRADHRRPDRRHPGRHLQPWLVRSTSS